MLRSDSGEETTKTEVKGDVVQVIVSANAQELRLPIQIVDTEPEVLEILHVEETICTHSAVGAINCYFIRELVVRTSAAVPGLRWVRKQRVSFIKKYVARKQRLNIEDDRKWVLQHISA